MDVRCERCETEYELEDDSVSVEGTKVQCTSCGHTFEVRRPAEGLPGSDGVDVPPPPADWLLDTGGGQVHRFRELTALQKWIIERKVTREDRISKTGQAWRRLGDIVELGPFFDVVDEADRGRAASPSSPAPSRPVVSSAGGLRDQAASARLSAAQRRTPGEGLPLARGSAGRSTEVPPIEAPGDADEIDTAVVRVRSGGRWKLLVGLGVAGAVAYAGITRLPQLVDLPARDPRSAASGGTAEPATPSAVVTPPGASEATGEDGIAAERAATPSKPPPAGALAPEAAAPGPAAEPGAGEPGAAEPSATSAPGAATAGHPARSLPGAAGHPARSLPGAAAAGHPAPGGAAVEPSYDRLVAEADRLLENGATGRALRLYQRALKQQPSGAEALAGLGYAHLDRQRTGAAIAAFRRALAVAPFAPAMFGIGEAYRAAGDHRRALEAYQRYLATSPDGLDAPAARRQIKALTEETDSNPPPPASILQEGAR